MELTWMEKQLSTAFCKFGEKWKLWRFCRYRDTDNRWGHRVDTISEKKYVNPEASVFFS